MKELPKQSKIKSIKKLEKRNDSNIEIGANDDKYITGSFYLPEMLQK